MKTVMKKIGLVLFAFMAMSVVALAQNNDRSRGMRRGNAPRMNKEQMVENMTKRQVERLKLTDEQAAKMKELNGTLVNGMMGERRQSTDVSKEKETEKNRVLTREEREERRKQREAQTEESRKNYMKSAKAILTPEQYAEFEKMQKEQQQRQGRRGQGNRGQGERGGNRGNFGGGQGRFGGNR